MRDSFDPTELARIYEHAAQTRTGWGPHGRFDERLCQVIDGVNRLTYAIYQVAGAKNIRPPDPVRRPGVLSARDLAVARLAVSAQVIDQIEAERAERVAAHERWRAEQARKRNTPPVAVP